MKKTIEIEVDIPDCISQTFINYLAMLDERSMTHIISFVGGVLFASGKITAQEAMKFEKLCAEKGPGVSPVLKTP